VVNVSHVEQLRQQRRSQLPWLSQIKVYIYDLHAAGFQSHDDVFKPGGNFCGDACPAQFEAPIWGADLCNHGYGEAVDEPQTSRALGVHMIMTCWPAAIIVLCRQVRGQQPGRAINVHFCAHAQCCCSCSTEPCHALLACDDRVFELVQVRCGPTMTMQPPRSFCTHG
jgi:hypothetical protein